MESRYRYPYVHHTEYCLLSKRLPVARVEHACSLCREPIEVGTMYVKLAYISEREFVSQKLHVIPCYGLASCRVITPDMQES